MANRLTKQQEGFCQSYHKHGNASQAYRENYNARNMKSKQIWEEASNLKSNPKVTQRLTELSEKVIRRHEGMTDRIIEEYAHSAFADLSDYLEWGENGIEIKESSKLSKAQLSAVASISMSGGAIKIVLNSKTKALDSLARIFGMNQDTLTVKHNQAELAEHAEQARERLKAISGTKK